MSRLIGVHHLPRVVPTPAHICCVLRFLPVFLQDPGPALRGRGRRGRASGIETSQTVSKPRTRKLPTASPQPGMCGDSWGSLALRTQQAEASYFMDEKTREDKGWLKVKEEVCSPSEARTLICLLI